jgi:hypothetical protein
MRASLRKRSEERDKEELMTIFGRPLSDYIAFCKPFLILVPLVGIVRLVLSLSGTPNATAMFFSMTALVWLAVVYYSIRIHTTAFGSYKQLLVICALLNLTTQVVSIAGILISIITGKANIFTAPEFTFGVGSQWAHVAAHVFIGSIAGSLVPWAVGSLILAITRKASPVPRRTSSIQG